MPPGTIRDVADLGAHAEPAAEQLAVETTPPPTPVPMVSISRSSTSSPAPNVNSPQAAALASFSTTTGSPSSSSRTSLAAARRARPGWARRRPSARALSTKPAAETPTASTVARAGELRDELRRWCARSRRGRVAGDSVRSRGQRPGPARRRARRRSWCRRRRRRPCQRCSSVLVPAGRRRRGRSSRPAPERGGRSALGGQQAGRGVHQRAGRHRQVGAHLRAGVADDVDHLAHRAVAAVLAAGRDVLVDVVGGVARTSSRHPRPLPA